MTSHVMMRTSLRVVAIQNWMDRPFQNIKESFAAFVDTEGQVTSGQQWTVAQNCTVQRHQSGWSKILKKTDQSKEMTFGPLRLIHDSGRSMFWLLSQVPKDRSLRPRTVHFRLDSNKEKNWGQTLYFLQTTTLVVRRWRRIFGPKVFWHSFKFTSWLRRLLNALGCSTLTLLLKARHVISGSHLERNCSRQFTEEVMANCQILTIFWVWLKVSHVDSILKDSYSIGFTALES